MLNFTNITLRSAELPKESPIPDIKSDRSLPFFKLDESITESCRLCVGEGMVPSVLPYTMQSIYDRDFRDRTYRAAVLENEYLRATFLPELGGRLWSLYDKRLHRELLYQNKVVAFANLALRNAWFAGGVEWNIGVRGHTHFTCSPLFTCKEENKQGDEILKMYEYEPIRSLAYVIRAGLFEDELRVNITIENTKNESTYLYWWSNIAIPQTKNTRVLVPTEKSYVTTYLDGGFVISHTDIPLVDGIDISYPVSARTAMDYFFDIPTERKKWIAAIEGDGVGLLQASTQALIGRKLFVWGNTAGGKHWNDWLTDGEEYAEIQAGLAKTQFEHLPMRAKEIVSWNECYRAVSVTNKDEDYATVCDEIDRGVSACDFGDFFKIKSMSSPIIHGSGRGALATMLNTSEAPTICSFPKSYLTDRDTYFASLIEKTNVPQNSSVSYAIDPRYLDLIDQKEHKNDIDRYMSGVIAVANGMIEYAEQQFLKVGGPYEQLALACLAQIEIQFKENVEKSYAYVHRAFNMQRDSIPLLILFGEIAIKAERYNEFITASEGVLNGRVRMYRAKCLIECDHLDEARAILSENLVIPDIREGEYALSTIWCDLYRRIIARDEHRDEGTIDDREILEKYPIPYALDFRMH